MTDDLPEKLIAYVTEAYELRDAIRAGEPGETLEGLHSALVIARQSIDRLERIVVDLVRIRNRAQNHLALSKEAFEDAVDIAIGKPTPGRLDEYATGREKQAEWHLAAMAELFALRRAERLSRDVDTAVEVAKTIHRGADNARRDLDTRIRLVGLEGRYES